MSNKIHVNTVRDIFCYVSKIESLPQHRSYALIRMKQIAKEKTGLPITENETREALVGEGFVVKKIGGIEYVNISLKDLDYFGLAEIYPRRNK